MTTTYKMTNQKENTGDSKFQDFFEYPATKKMEYECSKCSTENFSPSKFNGSDMIMFFCYKNPEGLNNPKTNFDAKPHNTSFGKQNTQQNMREFTQMGSEQKQEFDSEYQGEDDKDEKKRFYMFENEQQDDKDQQNQFNYEMSAQVKEFDKYFAFGDFEQYTQTQEFKPKVGKYATMNITGSSMVKTFGAMGMGYNGTDCAFKGKKMAKAAAQAAAETKCSSITFVFPSQMKSAKCMQKFMEQFYVSCTAQNFYFSSPESHNPCGKMEKVFFVTPQNFQNFFSEMNERAKTSAEMTCMSQQMTTAPANYCNPTTFANVVQNMAKQFDMECKCYEKDFMEKENMGGMVAASQGSMYSPKFMQVTYKPSDEPKTCVAFVGCGMTFDSGGYNMKKGKMDKMKSQMAGAATVMATAYYVGKMKPASVQVEFFIYAGENMVSATSCKPGDVFTTYNGKTIEVKNTDSATCMCMCDAIAYVVKNTNAEAVFEFSNTNETFAKAFGTEMGAMFSSDYTTMTEFFTCAVKAGENMFPCPFFSQKAENYSGTADYSTSSDSKYGKAMSTANFMKKFAQGVNFTHVEMNGPSYDSESGMGTGFGAATAASYVQEMSKKCSGYYKTQARKTNEPMAQQENQQRNN